MLISASIRNSHHQNDVSVSTNENTKNITIPAKADGSGSSINGGELLFLSLATCFCNDIYREATRRNMKIQSVEVSVKGEFGKEGEPAANITYSTFIDCPGNTEAEIKDLIRYVDRIAEIHNTLRKGVAINLVR